MGPIQTLDDVIDMIRRRWRVMAVIVALGCIASFFVALSQQHHYRATEVLQVAQPRISDSMAPSTVQGSAARRLQLVEQILMSRDNVLAMIEEFGLYTDMPALTPTEKVTLFRASVDIDGVAAARDGYTDDGSIAVLTFSADMATPEQAQQVAHALAQKTINLSRDARIAQARETLAFFREEERKLTAELTALEDEIAAFRARNQIAPSSEMDLSLQQIAAIDEQLLSIDRQAIAVQREIQQIDPSTRAATRSRLTADFQAQLDSLAEQRDLLATRRDALAAATRITPEIERALAEFDRRRVQLRERLDVVATRRTEAEVGFQLENERQGVRLTVLEEAVLPEYPASSSRKRKAILGAGASAVLAFLVAYLLELRNPVIRSAAQMKRELGLEPVVSIPYMDVRDGKGRRRRG